MPVSGSNGYRSGIVTLPNRVRLREMDSRLGMYPKIKRTGDKDRLGNDSVVPFDDREVSIFNKGVGNLTLGSLVTSGSVQSLSPYSGNNNPNGGITGTGNVIAGISDSFYMTDYKELSSRKNDSEKLSPYNDSRINLSDTLFYMTGTLESEYSGFSNRLHDKTQIVIDISSNEQTSIGLLNKTNKALPRQDTTDVKNQLMAYYNFKNKRWEKIARGINGNVTSGSLSSLSNMVETAALGFTNIGQIATGSNFNMTDGSLVPDVALSHYARPTKSFGFPFHPKYFATGSQVIKMSDYIASPMLIEKVQFHFDEMKFEYGSDTYSGLYAYTSFHRYGTTQSPKFALGLTFGIHTFFILRQVRKKENTKVTLNVGRRSRSLTLTSSNYNANIPGNAFLSPRITAGTEAGNSTTHVTASRELITYSQLTTFTSASLANQGIASIPFNTFENSSLFRDKSLRLSKLGETAAHNNLEFTGSLLIDAPVRVTPKTPLANALIVSCSDANDIDFVQGLYLDDEFGSRGSGNLDISSRALFNGQASFKKSAPYRVASVDGTAGEEIFSSADVNTLDENSPYILFPEDEIIIGYQFPTPRDLVQMFPDATATKKSKTVFEGPAKLTLFGSQIKNNQEFHDTLNQPLTSEAVHESLHYDNPVVDQYNINYRSEYSGSYLDSYRSQDESLNKDSSIAVKSIIGGTENQYPKSMQRFVRLSNNVEVFYDTMTPDPRLLWQQQAGISPFVSSSGESVLFFGESNSNGKNADISNLLFSSSNKEWFSSTVYDNSLGRVSFEAQVKNLSNTSLYFNDGVFHILANNNNKDQFVKSFKGFNFNESNSISGVPTLKDLNLKKKINNYLMWLYGFGSGPFKSLEGSNPNSDEDYVVNQRPRGYKYGIMSTTELFRSNVFRHDKFGQFADMLEQSIDTITYDKANQNQTSSPVFINFVSQEDDDTFKILNNESIPNSTFNSSNIDLAASSSLPFIDDDVSRNRGVAASTSTQDSTSRSTITVIRDIIN